MKKRIITISITIVVIIIISLFLMYKDQTITVLGYHDFTDSVSSNNMQITTEKFIQQMKYLKKHHYNTVTLEDIECYLKNECQLPRKSVLITIDDGFMSNYELAFPILKEYGFNAVVFYMGVNYDGHNSNYMDLGTIKKAQVEYPNIEFASHTYNLHHEEDYLSNYDIINEDFKTMHNIIQTEYFAYPYGHVSENIEKALEENNYKLAFTFGPGKEHRKIRKTDDQYHLPRLFISSDMPFWKFILRLIIPR